MNEADFERDSAHGGKTRPPDPSSSEFLHSTDPPPPAIIFLSFISLLSVLGLSSCGYIWQKSHGTDQLLELSGGMSQQQVQAIMGKPDSIAYDENNITITRYKLYDTDRTDWPWWIGPDTLFPFSPPSNYLISFNNGQFCNWINAYNSTDAYAQNMVAQIQRSTSSYCKTPRVAKYPAPTPNAQTDFAKLSLAATNLPIFMPPPVTKKIRRLAVLPLSDSGGYAVATWVDLALNILRKQHSEIVLVDRDLRPIISEVLLQHSGSVSDDTIVRVGRMAGADSIITYNVEPFLKSGADEVSRYGGAIPGFVELKLVHVEEGTVLFKQRAMAAAQVLAPRDGLWPDSVLREAHRRAVSEASYFTVAALLSAFGDNPLGIVPDMKERDSFRLSGVFDGSPAHIAGLRKGDRISMVNGQPINAWVMLTPHSLPVTLTIEREGSERIITVANP